MLETVGHDVRHTLRTLARTPAFTIIAILTLTLGIGVTTAIVSVVDHVLLRSLPFRDADRLVTLLERGERGGLRGPSAPTAADWKRDPAAAQAFEGIAFIRGEGATISSGEANEAGAVAFIEPDFFSILGARAALGRLLTADDHRPDAPSASVISYELWQKTFGGDRSIIGKRILVDSVPTTVVGIMPLGASYPDFASVFQPVSHYKHQEILTRRGLHADSRTIGRLKPGIDSARAVVLMRTVAVRLAATYPVEQAHWGVTMAPMRDEILGGIGPTLYTLAAAALAVLLLTCANVANLLLARIASRTRELAVRAALGASRARLTRQLLTESLVLSVIGGVLGSILAAFAVGLARKLPPDRLPRVNELAVDGRVLAVAIIASIVTTVLCGLWPAIRATRASSAEHLRSGSRGGVGLRSETRTRRALVAVQFALALILLVGAGLLVQSFRRAMTVDIGFDPTGLVLARLNPSSSRYPTADDAAGLYTRLIAAARAVPGVEDAAFIQHFPFGGASILSPVEIDGRPASDTASSQVLYRTVSDRYLQTMKMHIVAGRWFDGNDVRSPGGAFVVNQAMAKQYWAGESPVGKRMTLRRSSQVRPTFGEPLPGVVVGVVADVHQVRQDFAPQPEVYIPYTLEPWAWGNIVVRARDAASVIHPLRDAIAAVDPQLVERGSTGDSRFTVVNARIDNALAPRKLSMWLIGGFAGCALILAAIGMYGVVVYGITQRTKELGVRKALGATDRAVASLVLRESLILAGVGVVVGCAGAWAATRFIRDQLFNTPAVDPAAYGVTIALLTVVALIATYIPARRAMRLDPTIAMRAE
ncbi:MAG TPA: ABC transporter permease [Gemmatimonadaceae bacterium]|jgi:putative ABC transport system permease protein